MTPKPSVKWNEEWKSWYIEPPKGYQFKVDLAGKNGAIFRIVPAVDE